MTQDRRTAAVNTRAAALLGLPGRAALLEALARHDVQLPLPPLDAVRPPPPPSLSHPDQSTSYLTVGWLFDQLDGCLTSQPAIRPVGWLFDQLAGCLIGWCGSPLPSARSGARPRSPLIGNPRRSRLG